MVLESLVSLKEGIKNPLSVFYLSVIVTLISFIISFIIFKHDVGLYSVILTTFGLIPFMTKLCLYEGKKVNMKREEGILNLLFFYLKDKKSILRLLGWMFVPFFLGLLLFLNSLNITVLVLLFLSLYLGIFLIASLFLFSFYREVIMVFVAAFTGMTLTFSIIYLLLPAEIAEKTFKTQIDEIKAIRGYFWLGGTFQTILANNIGVLFIVFLFSFIYGSGAIFILAWNASILATAASMLANSLGGAYKLPIALISYLPHGSLEIIAYFLAAIAGAIVSYYFTRNSKSSVVIEDSLLLLALGLVFLLLGAAIETILMIS